MRTATGSGIRWLELAAIFMLFLIVQISADETDLETTSADCYYNYNHYSEGDRILTNEPCLNCTCHNKMLMCYLKVCPFTKPIGQDCTIEKREDQCCPIITCPEVPVELDQSTQSSTDLATNQQYGCSIDDEFYAEGAQVPGNPKKPCELCYCIRNMTSCVMQECTLHVDGCRPIYNKGVCCPVRYDCAHEEEDLPMIEDTTTTTEKPSEGFVITTTSSPARSTDCTHNNERYIDGELIETPHACEHCYCMRGDIVCAVQECKPLEMHGKNCTARAPNVGECCPSEYECESDAERLGTTLYQLEPAAITVGYQVHHDEAESTTLAAAQQKDDKESAAVPSAPATTERIDESENEIHDKDYDHRDSVKPTKNFTAQHDEAEESTTLFNELEKIVTSTIVADAAISEDGKLVTASPSIASQSPQESDEKKDENAGILSGLYTTIRSIVELTTFAVAQDEHKEEEGALLSNVIPGEGDCLENGVNYGNDTTVPTRNICEVSCRCFNSIVQCERLACPAMPSNAGNCKIVLEQNSCCPSYQCESIEMNTEVVLPALETAPQADEEPAVGTTSAPSVDSESQTSENVEGTTAAPSQAADISGKLDDDLAGKPEIVTETEGSASGEEQTAASALEKATPAPALEQGASQTEQQPESQTESKGADEEKETGTSAAPEKLADEVESTTAYETNDAKVEQVKPTTQGPLPEQPAESSSGASAEDSTTQAERIHDEPTTTQDSTKLEFESGDATQKPAESQETATDARVQDEEQKFDSTTAKADETIQSEQETTEKQVEQKPAAHTDEASTEPQSPAEPSIQLDVRDDVASEGEGEATEQPAATTEKRTSADHQVPEDVYQPTEHRPYPENHDVGAYLPYTGKYEDEQAVTTEAQPSPVEHDAVATETQQTIDEATTAQQQRVDHTPAPVTMVRDESVTESFDQKLPQVPLAQFPNTQTVDATKPQQFDEEEKQTPTTQRYADEEQPQATDSPAKEEESNVGGSEAAEDKETDLVKPEDQDFEVPEAAATTAKSSDESIPSQTEASKLGDEQQPETTTAAQQNEPSVNLQAQENDVGNQEPEQTATEAAATESADAGKIVTEQTTTEKFADEQPVPEQSATEKFADEQAAAEQTATEKMVDEQPAPPAEHAATEQSATEQAATEKFADEQPAPPAEHAATEQSATEQAATEKFADEQPAPEQVAQEQSSTDKSATEQASTEKFSDEQPATEQAAPEHSATEQSATEQAATEKFADEQPGPEQTATEKIADEQPAPEKAAPEHPSTEQSATEQAATEKFADEQPALELTATEKITDEQAAPEHSATEQSATEQVATEKLADEQPVPEQTATEKFAAEQPTSEQVAPEHSATEQSSTEQAATEKIADGQSVPEHSATEQSATEQAATERFADEQAAPEHAAPEQTPTEQDDAGKIVTEQTATEKFADEQAAPEQAATEKVQSPEQQPEIQATDAPTASDEQSELTTEKRQSDSSTTQGPSKQEDLDIVTDHQVPSKQEDLDIDQTTDGVKAEQPEIVEQSTESKTQFDAQGEEGTTAGIASSEEQTPRPYEESAPAQPSATEKAAEEPQATVSSEQPAFDESQEKTTEHTEYTTAAKQSDELVPVPEQPSQPEMESANQLHGSEEPTPDLVETPTTEIQQTHVHETPKPEAPSSVSDEDRFGDEQPAGTTAKSAEPQEIDTEAAASPTEGSKYAQTEQSSVVDVTTLLNKIHEATTQKQELEQDSTKASVYADEEQKSTEQAQTEEHTTQAILQPVVSNEKTEETTTETQQSGEQKPFNDEVKTPETQTQQAVDQQPEQHIDETATHGYDTTNAPAVDAEQPIEHDQEPSVEQHSTHAPSVEVQTPQFDEEKPTEGQQQASFDQTTAHNEYESGTQKLADESESFEHHTTEAVVNENASPEISSTEAQSEGSGAEAPATEAAAQPEISATEATAKPEISGTEAPTHPGLADTEVQPEVPSDGTTAQPEAAVQSEIATTEASAQPEIPSVETTAQPEITSVETTAQPDIPSVEATAQPEIPSVETTAQPEIAVTSETYVSHDETPAKEPETSTKVEQEAEPAKPNILDATTIKSVVDLLTTLHSIEAAAGQQDAETTTYKSSEAASTEQRQSDDRIGSTTAAPQFHDDEEKYDSYATTTTAPAYHDEKVTEQPTVLSSPPESANNIPLIRDPVPDRFDDEHQTAPVATTTKLADSVDSTTLPSILFSSHTERFSDSTTNKNTHNEITEPAHHIGDDESAVVTHHEPEMGHHQPAYPQPASPYGEQVPSQYPDEEYTDEEEPAVFGPGTCRYGGKLYVSAQQIPRDDPCDFCFCFRSDIICLQQSCPPPITGCHEEPIQGFCCPRYECPVSMALVLNTTTTTTTTLPPYLSHFQRSSSKITRSGCQIQGVTYKIGERVTSASGPCIDCICGGDGQMKCDPKACTPEPMLRQMIAVASRR